MKMADHNGDKWEPLQRFATFEEYDKIWKTFVEKSPTEKRDWKIIQKSIQAKKVSANDIPNVLKAILW